jgi:RNA polymerase sigma factor (TIGR02999 family)
VAGATTPTELLEAWGRGDLSAFDRLVPLVHGELRRIALRYMSRERAGHTLQATALVNEAYLRLIEVDRVRARHRGQFLAMAAQVMRHILVDFARARRSEKRRADLQVTLDEGLVVSNEFSPDLIALDEALQGLAAVHPRKSQVVELRYFGGLTHDEIGEMLGVSIDTVKRDWRFAKLWLLRELGGQTRPDSRASGANRGDLSERTRS